MAKGPPPLSDARAKEALVAYYANGESEAKAAAALNISRTTIQHRIRLARDRGFEKDIAFKGEAKLKTKIKLLEGELKQRQRAEDSAAETAKKLYNISQLNPDPPAWVSKPRAAGSPGMPMLFCSDWHFGEVVEPEEVGGRNKFNTTIAKRRVKSLTDITVDLALHRISSSSPRGIVVPFGGDMITGDIHEELQDTNDEYLLQSLNDVVESMIAMLATFADKFGQVWAPCVVGNHGRISKKPRMKGRVKTNYEWNAYCQVKRYFANDKRITVSIPEEADSRFSVLGHRFLLTHGDSLGVKGGDGIIGSIGPIKRGEFKIGRSESAIGRDFDTLIIGHFHQYIPGMTTIVNGSLKGFDEYAHLGLRARFEPPVQALWFVHEKYGIIWQTPVYVDDTPGVTFKGKIPVEFANG